jgi:hypothetical protein
MVRRRLPGWLPIVAIAIGAMACNDKDKADASRPPASAADLDKRCELVAKACGDKAKHVEKILDQCKQAAVKQVVNGCTDKAIAAYDCYVKDLCGNADKVWAIEDISVLGDRHKKCVVEQTAMRACSEK